MFPGGELGASVEGDRLARVGGQGSQPVDQGLLDRLGLAIFTTHLSAGFSRVVATVTAILVS